MKVEIWSDVMCPFCYVGKKHFENALAQLPFKDKIEVEWKSFQLDPTLPVEGASESTLDYLVKRKGMPKEQIEGMMHHLDQSGAAVGIEFRQDIAIPVNTFRAHRLIHLAQIHGKGNEMEEALFFAHFTAGKNVGDLEVLTDLATSIGLNKEEVVALLQSEEQTQEVKNDIEEAQALGISGVPFFVVDRKYGISGAQPIDTFAEALTQAYEESQPKFEMKGNQDANACGPDGCEI
ncbi:putative DsbA family dithiol-disulfide isomerase [Myroides gitamensis]|uniref:DsbA family oxidoreductase n=1 Tax=Myroides odoratus TaxID=256 RepID=UPI00216A4C4F|nr:DsbA family oxidoreductase [Myroides odoratus]MCS4240350.1 putative DsbA family dithiol-disulfide isomerase [Myroides odoratus]MDH6601491.1 putative DsbA family dithiol-disulfide isomerase [Myroides gitamensis]